MNNNSDTSSTRVPYTPEGWLIKACKYLNVPNSDHMTLEQVFRQVYQGSNEASRDVDRDLVFGNYDRIQVLPINSLAEFTRTSNKAYDWLGMNQSILLYHWDGKNENHKGFFQIDKEGRVHTFRSNRQEVDRANQFFAVSFCYLSDWMRNHEQENYQNILNICEEKILSLTEAFNQHLEREDPPDKRHSPVIAEVFGSLSSAELVILWSARQYTDILYLIDTIRDFRYQLLGSNKESDQGFFRTTYTMFSFPDATRKAKDASWETTKTRSSSFSSILGTAQILFSTQSRAGASTYSSFSKFLNKCLDNVHSLLDISEAINYPDLIRCAGEYDLAVSVDSCYLSRLFSNPLIWHEDGWTFPADTSLDNCDVKDCTCSVHHPLYNQYILYSSTRLTYKPEHLPNFVSDQSWEDTVHRLIRYPETPEKRITSPIPGNRSEMIWRIRLQPDTFPNRNTAESLTQTAPTDWDMFQDVILLIQQNLPASSSLSAELQQLFSDYVQCCCSSADILWIEDYIKLFRQMLDHIKDSVKMIQVWKDYDINYDNFDWLDADWRTAQKSIEGISKLVRSFQHQSSHITTSNKLFFREQEAHFGYTAQHDLVIHAYYDIVKYLIEFIYCNSNIHTQSPLYPLVNFVPDDKITSNIYTEESADLFLRMGGKLRSRIMAIQIPQDGLDNMMYYLPMLVHEVYHYSAPANRKDRNRILAKIAVFHALRYGFSCLLDSIVDNHRDDSQAQTETNDAYASLFRCIDNGLFHFIEKVQNRIFEGVEETFFVSEQQKDWHEPISDKKFIDVQKGQVLQSWFLIWMKRWLCENYSDDDYAKREALYGAKHRADPDHRPFQSLFDDEFQEMVFQTVHNAMCKDRPSWEPHSANGKRWINQFQGAVQNILSGDENEESDLFELYASAIKDYVLGEDFLSLMDQLDELFPDVAMVKLCNLSLAGYMLQTALTLDKQIRHCSEHQENYIRFGAILHLLNPATDKQTLSQSAQDEFSVMYQSAYDMFSAVSLVPDSKCEKRAVDWCSTFSAMYQSYMAVEGFDSVSCTTSWITELIESQMLPCLDLTVKSGKCVPDWKRTLEEKRKQLFETPYLTYLNILKDRTGSSRQQDLFRLSFKTILQFQRYRTIGQMQKDFEKETPVPAASISAPVTPPPLPEKSYIIRILSASHYQTMIEEAVNKLHSFRKQEGLSDSIGMWYRGVANSNYPILPSGFVHFAEDAFHLNGGLIVSRKPYRYLDAQLRHYEAFRYSAEGSSPEVTPSQYKNTFNYLTLMQHYSQNTNLLDWSEDCFASTYFALEDEININDKYQYQRTPEQRKKEFKNRNADAVLYVLDPVRFNLACQELEENSELFDVSPLTKEFITSPVPNLSIEENHCLYREYHSLYHHPAVTDENSGMLKLPQMDDEDDARPVTLQDIHTNHEKLQMHLPRAVYAAKLNSRIQAQSGLFVAFSLNSIPAVWNGSEIRTSSVNANLFRYQALEEIQEYYLNHGDNKRPFLMKIVIPCSLKDQLGKMFYDFGSSKERIYPELQNHRKR